ncbi:MAG: hypothetical protein M9933_19195, partial [Chitinophagaceae bacterium]|nr:hypothetical protein [Chitinophagaceae bacterium]
MVIRRFVYLPYYVFKTNWKLFFKYLQTIKKEKNTSYLMLLRGVLYTMIKLNASPLDYFSFRMFDLPREKWFDYPCTGFMYEYQLKMNPPEKRILLKDKKVFLEEFKDFSGRQWATLETLKKDRKYATAFLQQAGKRLVVKNATGQAGKQVDVIDIPANIPDAVITLMEKGHFDLAEHYVEQHDELMRMSPSALNTVRMVTQYAAGDVVILLAFLRISVNSEVDNLSVGSYGVNFGASINLEKGIIDRPGSYLDSSKPDVHFHPVTQVPIVG